MTLTADGYINRVLDQLPWATHRRQQIETELRGHISERLGSGQPLEDVLGQLGDPVALAESYLSAVPLVSAPALRRVQAKLIDVLVIMAAVAPFSAAALLFSPPEARPFLLAASFIAGSFLFALYPMVAEARYGRTIGKRLFGLRVVRESGARISVGQSIVRQLPVALQVLWIDALFALFTERSQRAFELLSKTRVVVVRRGV